MLAHLELKCKFLDVSAVLKLPVLNGIKKEAHLSIHCAPISTMRTGRAETTYGSIGVKVWIYRGEDNLAKKEAANHAFNAKTNKTSQNAKRAVCWPKQRGNFVHFGEFGIQVLERGWITNQQIEACRVAINRFFQRRGKVWIRIFPDKPVTKKPAEVRMGKGKGAVDHWVAVVRPGRILFEVANVPKEMAQSAFDVLLLNWD